MAGSSFSRMARFTITGNCALSSKGCGYAFRTCSDTEVIAHGYDAWSIDGLLARLDGMYAIAIHDQDSNELHLARDRFGEKPLFYSARREGFAFGSTLLAVSAMPWVSETSISFRSNAILHSISSRADGPSCATSSACCRASVSPFDSTTAVYSIIATTCHACCLLGARMTH
jgi:asparagine synthetase B (glutamine-hydrolysing)